MPWFVPAANTSILSMLRETPATTGSVAGAMTPWQPYIGSSSMFASP
jgi:hypothetical protein